jgi:glycosyltransferase involved in cell wall biosynthesis
VKIALATDWFPPRRGGVESQVSELAARLCDRGHAVDVFTTTPDATNGQAYRVRQIRSWRLPGAGVAISPALPYILQSRLADGYDVVHAHASVVSPLAYSAAIAARRLGLPTIVSFHSVLHLKRHVLQFVAELNGFAKSPTVWGGVSGLVTEQLRFAIRGGAVVSLSNGLDVRFWTDASVGRAAASGPIVFVSASRLQRKKRPLALLQAFARARTAFNAPALLILTGDGPDVPALRRAIAELGLDRGASRAELRGWLTPAALRSLYARAHAFVQASRHESFGIAALEARATGLPVIALRASGSSEFLHDRQNALLCDDDEELGAALVQLVNNADLRARLTNGPTALDRYDWSSVLVRHEATYAFATTRANETGAAAHST